MPDRPEGFLPKGGNYWELLSYRKSEIIYDLTFRFCESHLKRGDRTIDQMVQAARSGKQNIAEGSKHPSPPRSRGHGSGRDIKARFETLARRRAQSTILDIFLERIRGRTRTGGSYDLHVIPLFERFPHI
jgi:hypothetical protein